VREITGGSISNGQITFTDNTIAGTPKRYVAVAPDKYLSVENVERIQFMDLRASGLGAEFIIITHEDFYSEARRLEGHRENGNPDNRLDTEVIRISDIYNNFSGGLMDPTAIRDFLKYAYDNWSPRPSFVLLLGDGDYDYKNIISQEDRNWLPPYQTDDLLTSASMAELESRTTDSWFTYLAGNDVVMDMAIGRINAQTLQDAKNAVDKIIAYETQPLWGSWRNTITVIGDDELVSGGRPDSRDVVHINQAETIAERYVPKIYNVEKIYLSEYPKVVSASVSGVQKPAARAALIEQINKGTLIVNFTGHGNSTQWAHEVLFQQADNAKIENSDKLTFFVAATCDWALFDSPQKQSQAEELLLKENAGAISILSSGRLVFSSANATFNYNFYENLFLPNGLTRRLGAAFVATRAGRVSSQTIVNDEKFHIYGDPTLRLAVPGNSVVITEVTPDSIVALNTIAVAGEIRRGEDFWQEYTGKLSLDVFDSRKFVENVTEANGIVQKYFLPGNSIFRGTVPVKDGRFLAKFIVPKDISYGGTQARLSAYAWNDQADGTGFIDDIVVSSTSSNLVDATGPEVKITFKGFGNFTSGDIIDQNSVMVVELADSISGINIAGEIGHRITLSIDPDQETCLSQLNEFAGVGNIDLTDLFNFDEGDHLKGKIEYPMQFPSEVDIAGKTIACADQNGEDRHTLLVKAWDNSNNSSIASVEVVVIHEEGLVLEDVMNYPNPFRNNTTFTFKSNRDAEIRIKIFTLSGRLIQTLEYPFAVRGFNKIEWDGRDADGDIPGNGVYLYKIIARAEGFDGATQKEEIGKLAIVR
jgi:hypothetical protein